MRDRTKKKALPHCCIDCAIPEVYQYGDNPILARCSDGSINVARYPLTCARFRPMTKIRCIENRPKKIGI